MIFRRALATFTPNLTPTIRQLLSPGTTANASPIQVNGWVKSVRRQKRVAFAVITDGSSTEGLQAVFTDVGLANSLTTGSAVKLTGVLAGSIGPGQDKELKVQSVDVVGQCDPENYPIMKRDMTTEYLRDYAHLRARTETFAATLRLRDSTQKVLQSYFSELGFCYTHTPLIVSTDCEGAGETFRVQAPTSTTKLDQQVDPSSLATNDSSKRAEFFGRPAYLTVSSQLHLEVLAQSLARVYTIAPSFRAERSQTGRHLSEFWMLEAEWAFTNHVDDVCQVVEGAVKRALTQDSTDLAHLRKDLSDDHLASLEKASVTPTWARMTYTEAVDELQKVQSASRLFKFEPIWGSALRSEHERWIADHLVGGPTFVTDYPSTLKPFYMRWNDDGKTVACFDLLVPNLGELVGGSLREERLANLDKTMKIQGMDPTAYEWYLDIRRHGGAPHGGFGLGFERLISWMSGVENVRECIPMPRWAGRMLL